MTQPPDWVVSTPSLPAIHDTPADTYQWQQLTEPELASLRQNLIESIVSAVVEAISGFLPFARPALETLGSIFTDLFGLLGNPTGLGTGTPGLGSLSSIPILGPIFSLFGGATTAGQAGNFFTNLLSLLGGPSLTGSTGSFDPVTAVEDFINNVLNPTGLLASIEAIVQALTGISGGSLNILGPLTGLFGPILDLFDGTGLTTGASNFTDNGDGTGFFDLGSLGSLVDNGDGTGMSIAGLLENLTGQLGTFQALLDGQQNIIDGIFNAISGGGITGNLPDVLEEVLRNIPFLNVLGIGGPGNIGGSVQGTWDNLISGLVGTVGSGAGLADLFNIGQQVSSNATKGGFSWDILGIRNNKSMITGLLPTSDSTVSLNSVGFGASAPTFGVTSSTAITGYKRFAENMSLGVISWLGGGVTNISDMRVNLWQMDPATGLSTLAHSSANIIGSVSATTDYNTYSLPTPLPVNAGDVYGAEIMVRTGTGTHNVVGATSWLPSHPTVFPRKLSSVRNPGGGIPPTTIAHSSLSYATNVPFIEFAVTTGAGSAFHDPQTTPFSTAGSVTFPIPSWANHIDVVGVPGGGGGHQGGTWGVGGAGGDAGTWVTATWDRTTHFTDGTVVSITVGAGGSAGVGGNGGSGGATSISIPGHSVTTAGGVGATSFDFAGSNHTGDGPGNLSYNGQNYVGGGSQSSYGAKGASPGGAGAGGNWVSFQPGGAGADGAVWIRAYQ